MTTIGNAHDAQRAVWGWEITCPCGCDDVDKWLYLVDDATDDDSRLSKRIIGQGERRTAWLINGVVYKVATRCSVNHYEHTMLTQWREAGAAWAPPTSLYEVADMYPVGTVTVLAMPYLPDDGGEIDQATLDQIKVAAPQTCRENYTSHAGRTYLIDGEDIEASPR